MFIDYTDEQKALRAKLRAYYEGLITPEVRAGLRSLEVGDTHRQIVRQMGADGWLGVGWPEEWGGQGRTGHEYGQEAAVDRIEGHDLIV